MNGASFRTDQPVAQGSWATAYGGFTGVAQSIAPGYPLPKAIGNVRVLIGDLEAPLYFVSPTQINFLIPAAVATGRQNVRVVTGAGELAGTVRIMSAAPGIFLKETTTNGQPPRGAILNQDYKENNEATPAKRGEVIQIFSTGPGAFLRPVEDGASVPRSPLNYTQSTPEVFIGGVPADVAFSGLAPDFAGLWQINAVVPNRSFLSGRVPLQIFVDGVESNEVSVFVAQ